MYVDGRWVQAEGGESFEVLNPAREEAFARVPDAGRGDMKKAIAAASRAFEEGPWPRMSRLERSRILRQIADGMAQRRDQLARVMVAEGGIPATVAASISVDVPIQYLYKCAEWALELDFEEMVPPSVSQTPVGPRLSQMLIVHQPVGVCGLIPTWNAPLICTVKKLGAAIATGCTMVIKPSPWCSVVHLELAKLVDETDLPRGVFNMVTGQGVDVSQELATNPMVDLISFTGGVPTGKRIMEAASGTLKRVVLELGGKSPNIIMDDADVKLIAPAVAAQAWVGSGQVCIASTRVLAPEKLHDSLVQEMVRSLESIKIGDPEEPGVLMGPLIREERRQAVEGHIHAGLQEGAKLATGGKRPAHLQRGYFLEPTILTEVSNDMGIAREEIFGPVLCVIPVKDIEEAIRIANDSRYGLAANIIATNMPRALEVAKQLRAGSVTINGAMDMINTPRGGFKESGLGREGGKASLYEYTEAQSINWLA
jgi:acyl-CoA reductase-like NAD-dependent aldehyde dehydrogenase